MHGVDRLAVRALDPVVGAGRDAECLLAAGAHEPRHLAAQLNLLAETVLLQSTG